jgi:hypothetical protein
MNDRKRPLWPLVTAALIGLPVLYVASFGPACWLDIEPVSAICRIGHEWPVQGVKCPRGFTVARKPAIQPACGSE